MNDFIAGLFYATVYGYAAFASIMFPMIVYALVKQIWRGK